MSRAAPWTRSQSLSEREIEPLDRTSSTLSDPTRRDILEEANLVTTEKRGRTRDAGWLRGIYGRCDRVIEHYRRQWERRLERLEEYLEHRRKGGER